MGTGELLVLAAEPDAVHLEAHFTTSDPITAPLGQLITDVWLNPAIHELHWHLDTVAPARPTSRQLVPPTTPARIANRL
ncbi:hypothetical protein GR130_08480 [Streptomyces sp. GS7]|nr:hypothetical protein GR130_08480 [Streptomyces sp. GS7]